ncbi:MAG: polynucleotide kinase-phosphatase, partial [Hymenobacter sp.]
MPQDTLKLPELALVLLIGSTGAGKSTFARRLFQPTEIVSSDTCRGLVSDDENNLAATDDAFDLLHYWVAKRLQRGRLTVVDATNVRAEDRKSLVALARQHHCLPVAVVLDVPDAVAEARNRQRPDRQGLKPHVIANHRRLLRQSLRTLKTEGFRQVVHLRGVAEVDAVQTVLRDPLYSNRQAETGPFDIIGDVHGCYVELCELLEKLGYAILQEEVRDARDLGVRVGRAEVENADAPPRRVIFLGDLVDRGPASPQVLRLVMSMVRDGLALCVPGNHDIKLLRHLNGKNVSLTHGLAETVAQLESEPAAFKEQVRLFLDGLTSHYVLDGGRLVVAHAGMPEAMQGRGSGAVRSFALFGETTGETDEFGLPVRYAWAADYRGRATVVYGHTP